MIPTHNDRLFETLSPFLVATADARPFADLAPWGLETRWHIDPHHSRHATFFELLQRLDALTFGPEGMPMDKWVFYDCAEVPGFIYGFALDAAALTAAERVLLSVPDDYVGPVPFSMYIAIPMREPGAWFGHNLASLNRQVPERSLSHLGSITKAFAMKAFRCQSFFGATQWQSNALFIHTKFGPLDLATAYTPAHSLPATLTYTLAVDDRCLRAAAGDPSATLQRPEPDTWLDATDVSLMLELQRDLEAGARVTLVGPPKVEGSRRLHALIRGPR